MAYGHLWNDLPFEERGRLLPYAIECQIRHIEQTRAKVVAGHKETLRQIDVQLENLRQALARAAAAAE